MSTRSSAVPLILVADDDPLIVAEVGRMLRAADFAVCEAYDSAGALLECVNRAPALAIIDYSMPGSNGVELARQIAAKTEVPVMFLTAHGDKAVVDDAIAVGVIAYLIKPVDPLQLVSAVRTALQRSHEMRALRSHADHLNSALQTGRNVSIATGLLMAQFQISQQEALERLRRQARSRRTRLEAFASELLRASDEAGRMYESLSQRVTAPEERKSGEGT